MVYWITGRSGAGKTTYAKKLRRNKQVIGNEVILIDGDHVRQIFGDADYSMRGVRRQILRCAFFSKLVHEQDFTPIVSLVSPISKYRKEAYRIIGKENIHLIYVRGGEMWEGTYYEEPDSEETSCCRRYSAIRDYRSI